MARDAAPVCRPDLRLHVVKMMIMIKNPAIDAGFYFFMILK